MYDRNWPYFDTYVIFQKEYSRQVPWICNKWIKMRLFRIKNYFSKISKVGRVFSMVIWKDIGKTHSTLVFDSEAWPDVLHYFSSLPYENMVINYQFLHFQQIRDEIRDNERRFRNNHREVQALLVSIQILPPLNQVKWPNHVARPTHANLYCHHRPLCDPLTRLRSFAL